MTQAYKRSRPADLSAALDPALFKALGDATRTVIVADLGRRATPTTVTEAAGCCPVDLSVVSRHLAVLREAGVVTAEKHGREVRYTVSHKDLAERLRSIADALDACCRPAAGCCPPEPTRKDTP